MTQHLIFARPIHGKSKTIHQFQVEGLTDTDALGRFVAAHPGMVATIAPRRLVED